MLTLRTAVAAAAAATCMLSAAKGFSVPSLGPRPGISASCNPTLQTRRVSYPLASRSRCTPLTMAMATTPVVKRVAIVGAGVGGLTLANALCTEAMAVDEVKVFEKFDTKPGIGGGIQINSGAVILARLGLGDAIKVGTCMLYVYIPTPTIIVGVDAPGWRQGINVLLYGAMQEGTAPCVI